MVAFWYIFTLTQLEFGLKDLRRRTFQMEYSIDNHVSVALKREKLKDFLLENPPNSPKNVYPERAASSNMILVTGRTS